MLSLSLRNSRAKNDRAISNIDFSKIKSQIALYTDAIFKSYSEIFFLRSRTVGILLFLTTLLNPHLAISGIISVLAAYIFARLINMDQKFVNSGFYTYNPLLTGLAIGYLFRINLLTVFFIMSAGILTFILTVMLSSLFSTYFKLPILSLPFTLISSVTYLASSKYTNLFVTGLYPNLTPGILFFENYFPFWLAGYFRSLGTIFFLPYVIPGIILAVAILSSSRILFLLTILGYYTGTIFTGMLMGSYHNAFMDINHFNYILIAMAIGGIFLIPSIKSYILAIIAVAVSTLLVKSMEVFWLNYGIPGFTLPFNLVTLSLIYVLGLVNYPMVAKLIKSTPEETLDQYLSNLGRYGGTKRTLSLPFSGKWMVWQAFDGRWTHKGSLKYAYDFIITDDQDKSHNNNGTNLTDYYSFHKPVLSPVRGRVAKVVNSLPDNPIGQVDRTHVWGNSVIIEDERGFYVAISHLSRDLIKVREGDWVERGTLLGSCGNSGYSPQPHIHIQAQVSIEIGSSTLPFSFVSYSTETRFYDNDLPTENTAVESLYQDKCLDIITSFMLDDRLTYNVIKDGQKTGEITIIIKSAPDGTFYMDSGKGKLYFGKYEGTFYIYSYEGRDENLKSIFLALPKLPLAYKDGLKWEDRIPVDIVATGFKKRIVQFLSSVYGNLARTSCTFAFLNNKTIEGNVSARILNIEKKTRVELDDYVGFKSIKVDNLELRRVKNEQVRG
ncbi:MAG: urea transporter [Candidatus Eremiobacteraeota bacterium]|nr:urea transporter [Candidatus Eremiobacteraeota bacterium]